MDEKPKRAGTVFGDRGEQRKPRVVPDEFAEADQPATGVHEGEDLRRIRAQRPTPYRLERLEDKHDETRRDVADLRESVGRIEGKLDVLPQLVEAVQKSADRANQREQVTFTASVEVDKAKKLDDIKAVDDVRTTTRMKWELAGKVLALLAGGGVIGEIIHKAVG